MLGGGGAGPSAGLASREAGEAGEYHHSRNLMKNMVVGRRNLSELSKKRGEERMRRSEDAIKVFGLGDLGTFAAATAAARWV
jgi:hypothetical protein